MDKLTDQSRASIKTLLMKMRHKKRMAFFCHLHKELLTTLLLVQHIAQKEQSQNSNSWTPVKQAQILLESSMSYDKKADFDIGPFS